MMPMNAYGIFFNGTVLVLLDGQINAHVSCHYICWVGYFLNWPMEEVLSITMFHQSYKWLIVAVMLLCNYFLVVILWIRIDFLIWCNFIF